MFSSLEVSLQVDPRLVRVGFLAQTLVRGPKAVGLLHNVVSHADLILLREGVPADFGEGSTVLDFLELLLDGRRPRPRGVHIVFIYLELLVPDRDVHSKEVSTCLEGGDVSVPEVLFLQRYDEAVVDVVDELHPQRPVRFVPDAEQKEIDLVCEVQLGDMRDTCVTGDGRCRSGVDGCPAIHPLWIFVEYSPVAC